MGLTPRGGGKQNFDSLGVSDLPVRMLLEEAIRCFPLKGSGRAPSRSLDTPRWSVPPVTGKATERLGQLGEREGDNKAEESWWGRVIHFRTTAYLFLKGAPSPLTTHLPLERHRA